MQRVIRTLPKHAIDGDEVLNRRHLRREYDALALEPDLLRPPRRQKRGPDHRLARDRAGLEGLRARRVLVHEGRQELLIERTPVGADAHRLAVADRNFDNLAELQVALVLEANIAGIDTIFVERFGAGRMFGEQLVADVVEVADQRRRDPSGAQAIADVGHGRGGLLAIDGQAHQLRACPRQSRDLARGRLDVGGVGVGHRLHDDRRAPADGDRGVAFPDPNANGRVTRERPAGRFRHRKTHRRHTLSGRTPTEVIPAGF